MNTMLNISRVAVFFRMCSIVSSCLIVLCCRSAAGQEFDYQGEITCPGIVRFDDLPRRMYLDPELKLPEPTHYLEDSMVVFLERMLRSAADDEILIEAIRALQRVQVEQLADVTHVEPDLRKYLTENSNSLVRQACVSALASLGNSASAAAVAEYCVPRYESLCLVVEFDFVRWGGDALKATWHDRINRHREFSSPLIQLACRGLGDLQDASAVPVLKTLLEIDAVDFSARHAAAHALGRIDATQAADIAQQFHDREVTDRLLACALLERAQSDTAFQLLFRLCDDDSNVVASRGWQILSELKPSLLVDQLNQAAGHPEANVRLAAIRVLHTLPTVAGCELLQMLTADFHIGVRNAARNTLRILALADDDLKAGILKNAGASIVDKTSNWQQLEQSLVLLGELRHRDWQNEWIRLLEHPRAEVYVTAAWLLHLMPNTESADAINALTIVRYETIDNASGASGALQLTFLFQHAGFIKAKSLEPLYRKQFSKGRDPEMRGAGLWAIGQIYTDQPQPDLVAKLLERIFDDNMFDPEDFLVRRMSILALRRMDARSTISELQRARTLYGESTLLGEAVRWALPQLGGDTLPPLERPPEPIQDFPFSPL